MARPQRRNADGWWIGPSPSTPAKSSLVPSAGQVPLPNRIVGEGMTNAVPILPDRANGRHGPDFANFLNGPVGTGRLDQICFVRVGHQVGVVAPHVGAGADLASLAVPIHQVRQGIDGLARTMTSFQNKADEFWARQAWHGSAQPGLQRNAPGRHLPFVQADAITPGIRLTDAQDRIGPADLRDGYSGGAGQLAGSKTFAVGDGKI